MTNHVHLLLTQTDSKGLSWLMKSIGQLHSQYVNKRYGKSGHLWQGRFKSCLVQSESYVLNCYRYLELNPVRAGMVGRADEYPWSSFRANAKGEPAAFLDPHAEYLRLGRTPAEREAAYRHLFGFGQTVEELENIRNATNGGYALGDAGFKRTLSLVLGRPVEKGRAGRPHRQPAPQPDLLGEEKTCSVPD